MTNLNYNTHNYNSVMPLLMNYTPNTRIEECDASQQMGYNYWEQIISIEMRTLGTKSLKFSNTKQGTRNVSDKKNEIDDQKHVK